MKSPGLLTLLCLFWKASAQCDETFGFGSYYNSHMVLQKDVIVSVWGYAVNEGDLITVTFDDTQIRTTAGIGPWGGPKWEVFLPITSAGGPHTITVTDGTEGCMLQLDDVLFGDVYICSGQSNMEWRLDQLDDPEDDVEDAINYPDVRTFMVAHETSDELLFDLKGIDRSWTAPTDTNMGEFSAICWLFGRNLNVQLGYPIGLIQSTWHGTRIEAWSAPEPLFECFGEDGPPPETGVKNEPSVLWNAMIHPFMPMAIFGVIWYQGESNHNRPDDYYCSLPAMISDWRAKWFAQTDQTDPMFPFGEVQLAPWNPSESDTVFTWLRWAQAGNLGYCPNDVLERVYMAVAVDLPDFDVNALHPRFKRPIADRLALGAFAVAYGLQATTGKFQGPFPTSITVEDEEVVIEYDHGDVELDLRVTDGFELCCSADSITLCEDGEATWQEVEIISQGVSGLRLNISCTGDQFITGLRYLWREGPCELEMCPIYSVENDLPAPPYLYEGLISRK